MFTPILDLEVLNKATELRFTDVTGPDTGDGKKWDGIGGLNSTTVSLATLTVTDPNGTVYSALDVTALITGSWPVTGDIVFTDINGQWIDGYYSVGYKVWIAPTAITSFDDYSGTVSGTIRVHSMAHNILTGMYVTIAGVAGTYDGFHSATRIDANTYYIYGTFTVTDTGTSTPCYYNVYAPFVFANVEMAVTKMFANFCNMDEGPEADEYMKQADLLHGLLLGLRSALMTTTTARINNIYGRITRILDFNSIELTYT